MTDVALELYEELGRGAQGVVLRGCLVHPSGARREVAVKRLAGDAVGGPSALARLRDEGVALAALSHPSIPDFVDLCLVDEGPALLTRYVHGHDVAGLLDDGRVLGPRATAELMADLADALDAAWHARGADGGALGLVHRDVKPSNLRLDTRGHAWLLDFGLVRGATPAAHASTWGARGGTPAYLAPERVVGDPGGPPADVFALALSALELLGAPMALPFGWRALENEVLLSREGWEARLHTRLADVREASEGLRRLLARMAAWDPADRPAAAEVRREARALAEAERGPTLAAFAASLPVKPRPPTPLRLATVRALGAPAPTPRRLRWGPRGWLALGVGFVAAVGAGAGRGRLVRREPPRASDEAATALEARAGAPVAARAPAPDPEAPAPRPPLDAGEGAAVRGSPAAGPTEAAEPRRRREAEPGASAARAAAPPTPAPAAAEATPAAAVEAPPEPPAPSASWSLDGATPARLVRGGRVLGPGDVPAGAYTVEADFGEGFVPAGEVLLPEGEAVRLRCAPWRRLCEVAP